MGKQSRVIEVPKISCLVQHLDTGQEPASRLERLRGQLEKEVVVRGLKEKEHHRRVLLS